MIRSDDEARRAGAAALSALANDILLDKRALPAVYALAILLRLWWSVSFDPLPLADWKWYVDRASEMAAGHGYAVDGQPTAYWPVGYPAFLAALFSLFGQSALVVKMSQIALSAAIIYLTVVISRQAFCDERAIVLAALLLAVYPDYIAAVVTPFNELLFAAGLLLTHALMRGPSRPMIWALFAGVSFGGICLIKPQILFVPLFVLAVRRWLLLVSWRQALLLTAALYGGALALLVPWTVRNYLVFDRFVPVSNNGGVNLFIGNNPNSTGSYTFTPAMHALVREEVGSVAGLSVQQREVAVDKALRRLALRYIVEHPARFVEGIPAKLKATFLRSGTSLIEIRDGLNSRLTGGAKSLAEWQDLILWRAWQINRVFHLTALAAFLILCVRGAWRSYRLRHGKPGGGADMLLAESGAVVLYFVAVAAVFFGGPRFSMPIIPYLMIALSCASIAGLDAIVSMGRKRSRT